MNYFKTQHPFPKKGEQEASFWYPFGATPIALHLLIWDLGESFKPASQLQVPEHSTLLVMKAQPE